MKIIKYNEKVKLPSKSHQSDCGYDLYILEDFELKPLETKCLGLGLGIAVPEGFAGMTVPRSSSAKKGLIIQTQIIDPGYTGEIHLIITNCSNELVSIKEGDRVCSLVIYSLLNPYFEIVDELPNTDRGNNGLGSSGK